MEKQHENKTLTIYFLPHNQYSSNEYTVKESDMHGIKGLTFTKIIEETEQTYINKHSFKLKGLSFFYPITLIKVIETREVGSVIRKVS